MRYFLLILFILVSQNAVAGGFQVMLQGQKQMSMGNAGAGVVLDGACVFYNPGMMSMLAKRSVFVGFTPLLGMGRYVDKSPSSYTQTNQSPWNFPFNAYFNYKNKPESRWSFGLGIYTPFGLRLKWADDWRGRFIVQETDLKTVFVQPTVGFKITDELGVGLGVNVAYGSVTVRRALPLQDQTGSEGNATLSGSAISAGVNIGFYYKPIKQLSIGLTWRSPVPFSINNGKATFKVPETVADQFPKTNFKSKLTLPMVLTLGLGFYPTDKLALTTEVNFTGWSAFDSLKFNFEKNTPALTDQASPRMYKDALAFRVGMQYQVTDKISARAGFLFDMTPVKDDFLSPELPDGHLIGPTFGLSALIANKVNIDATFMYVTSLRRTTTNVENNFTGTYQVQFFIPSVGVHYLF